MTQQQEIGRLLQECHTISCHYFLQKSPISTTIVDDMLMKYSCPSIACHIQDVARQIMGRKDLPRFFPCCHSALWREPLCGMTTLQTSDKSERNNFYRVLRLVHSTQKADVLSSSCRVAVGIAEIRKDKHNICERRRSQLIRSYLSFRTSYIPRQNRINSKRYCIRSGMYILSGALLFTMRFRVQKYCFL